MAQTGESTVVATTPSAGEPGDRLFMTLSEQIGSQHLQLGVYLGIEPSTVQGIIDGCTTAILAPFFILRAWRDGRRKQANPGAMLDELCCALSDIKRDDLTGEVRLEQTRVLKEELRLSKKEIESCRQQHEEEVRQLNDQVRVLKEESQKYKEQAEKANVVELERAAEALTAERIRIIKAAAKTHMLDDDDVEKRKRLDVITLLCQYRQPELWIHVSDVIIDGGRLDVSSVITGADLPAMEYLLASGVTSDVTSLNVGGLGNRPINIFGDISNVKRLCRGLSALPQLRKLKLYNCELRDEGFIVVCCTIRIHCYRLEELDCPCNQLSSAVERHVSDVLTAMPYLSVLLSDCFLPRDIIDRLRESFLWRFNV